MYICTVVDGGWFNGSLGMGVRVGGGRGLSVRGGGGERAGFVSEGRGWGWGGGEGREVGGQVCC